MNVWVTKICKTISSTLRTTPGHSSSNSSTSSSFSGSYFFHHHRDKSSPPPPPRVFTCVRAVSTSRWVSTTSSLSSLSSSSSSSMAAGPTLNVPLAPPDAILGVSEAFRMDKSVEKVDLSVGAYRDENGKSLVFQAVRNAEKTILQEQMDKEYLPIDGLQRLKTLTQKLIFGEGALAITEKRICSVQSISGSGALRLAGEIFKQHLSKNKVLQVVYISSPTWVIHKQMYSAMGFDVRDYPYWDNKNRNINMDGMIDCLNSAPEGSMLVLHSCAHNPTGMDPTKDQWQQILSVVQRRRLLPLLDTAYQGYGSGSLTDDAYAVRLFEQTGMDLLVCQSFAKNIGLYGERIGMLHLVCSSPTAATNCLTQLKYIVRCLYSSPPLTGARILEIILTTSDLRKIWEDELTKVADRIKTCRENLRDGLILKKTPGNWDHITRQIGMFSYTGLTVSQCELLTSKWHVYLIKNGRISLAGLNKSNVGYVVDAIDDVVRHAE